MPVTYESIATTTLGTATGTVSFTNISLSYTDLRLVVSDAKVSSAERNVQIRVGNGSIDSGSNYSMTNLGARALSATPFSDRSSNQTIGRLAWFTAMTTAQAVMSVVDIMNYSNTTTNKTMLCSTRAQPGDATYSGVEDLVILWRSTAAINYLDVICADGDTFQSGSTFTLYGIKAA
jgi:hypothetical protein